MFFLFSFLVEKKGMGRVGVQDNTKRDGHPTNSLMKIRET